jgi:hypothetical protein
MFGTRSRLQPSIFRLLCAGLVSVAAAEAGCGGDSAAAGSYGSVRLFLQESRDCKDCFAGTRTILIQGAYNGCATNFYTRVPAAVFVADEGKSIAEEWEERLCAEKDPSDASTSGALVKCSVVKGSLEQLKDTSGSNNFVTAVRYRVTTKSNDLAGLELRLGPIPDKELAKCGNNEEPKFLLSTKSVIGLNEDDDPIWDVESYRNPEIGAGYRTKFIATIKNFEDEEDETTEEAVILPPSALE